MHDYEPQVLKFVLKEGKTIRVGDLERFKSELEKLLQRKRSQFPKGGDFIFLDYEWIDVNQRIQLVESLKTASFVDIGNWGQAPSKNLGSQLAWWTLRMGLDVVCFPGYTDQRELLRSHYRIFTRPTYLER